ncbi:MAG TPA: M56 family metallopeptidase [Thermoanaerobaculia bacterium]|nr:M56 family metallopeptidase [Thermoanaerobaculia bacterium]
MSLATLPYSALAWLFDATIKSSIVILLVVAVQLTVGRRVQARWRHALWLLVVVRLLLPAVPSSRWSLFNLFPVTASGQPTLRVDAELPRELAAMPIGAVPGGVRFFRVTTVVPMLRWLFFVWLAGALLLTARMVISSLRMRRAVNRARRREARGAELDALLRLAMLRAGGRRSLTHMRILESEIVRTPALHGLVTPTLLLPRGMTAAFTADELRHVVLHELWHVRRLDVAVNWLLSIAQAIHWFNPFVWLATSRIREERELACDELTLSCLEEEERISYGTTILKLLERFRAAAPVPALVGIVDHKQKMKRRLMMITSYQGGRRFSAAFAVVLAAITFVAFTDARAGERHFFRKLDPSAIAAMESLHQRVTIDLTNATLPEVLSAVGAAAHVNVTQAADLASADIQQARFTLKAENVPAHAVLMEALMPFGLALEPSANGALVTKEPHGDVLSHEPLLESGAIARAGEPGDRVIIINEEHHAKADGDHAEMALPRHLDGVPGDHQIFIRHNGRGDAKLNADGKLHRELTINMEQDGVKSEGKLTLDISAPPAVK